MNRQRLTGLVAAPFTPMTPAGELDLRTVEPLAASLAGAGAIGVFVCGTTGEWPSLTLDERMQVAQRWRQAGAGRLKVIVHVGGNCQADSAALAEHAKRIEADGVAALAPFFFKPQSPSELAAFFAPIAAAGGDLPFYYYHIPSLTGVNIAVAEFLAVAARTIPTLAGAKFTYEDLKDFHRAMELEGGRFDLLFGRDEILLSALALGCRGAVGSTYTFAAPLYLRLMRAFDAGDIEQARRLQSQAREMVRAMNRHGGLAAGKAMMKLIGLDCGPARAPLVNLDGSRLAAMRADLEAVGFFEFAAGR